MRKLGWLLNVSYNISTLFNATNVIHNTSGAGRFSLLSVLQLNSKLSYNKQVQPAPALLHNMPALLCNTTGSKGSKQLNSKLSYITSRFNQRQHYYTICQHYYAIQQVQGVPLN